MHKLKIIVWVMGIIILLFLVDGAMLPIRANNNLTTSVSNPINIDFNAFDSKNFSVIFTSNKSSPSGGGAGLVLWSLANTTKKSNTLGVKTEDDSGLNQGGAMNWMAVRSGEYNFTTGKMECGYTPVIAQVDPAVGVASFNNSFPNTSFAIVCSPSDDVDTPVCNPLRNFKTKDNVQMEIRDDSGAARGIASANWCAITYGNHTIDGKKIKAGSVNMTAGNAFEVGFGTENTMPNEDYVTIINVLVPKSSGSDCTCDVQNKTKYGFNGTCYIDNGVHSDCGVTFYSDWIALEVINDDLSLLPPEPPTDTCTYSSGDWNINAGDNCVITTDNNIGGNKVTIYGTGKVDIGVGGKIRNFIQFAVHGVAQLICRNTNGCFG